MLLRSIANIRAGSVISQAIEQCMNFLQWFEANPVACPLYFPAYFTIFPITGESLK